MEKQPHQEYRDELADKLKEIRNSDSENPEIAKAKAQGYLSAKRETSEFADAEKEKKERVCRERIYKEFEDFKNNIKTIVESLSKNSDVGYIFSEAELISHKFRLDWDDLSKFTSGQDKFIVEDYLDGGTKTSVRLSLTKQWEREWAKEHPLESRASGVKSVTFLDDWGPNSYNVAGFFVPGGRESNPLLGKEISKFKLERVRTLLKNKDIIPSSLKHVLDVRIPLTREQMIKINSQYNVEKKTAEFFEGNSRGVSKDGLVELGLSSLDGCLRFKYENDDWKLMYCREIYSGAPLCASYWSSIPITELPDNILEELEDTKNIVVSGN